ncbi:MAG: NADH-quinone oxidoreductase subunit L [Chitinophagaceae bacterium]|nr:NADH-quinone oxidoreductase subunit L [Chitinophagaceae bacterium]
MSHVAFLVPLFPLLGFLINGLGRNQLSRSMSGWIGTGAVFLSFLVSCFLFGKVLENGGSTDTLFYLIRTTDLSIPFAFQVDQLSGLFLLIITGIGTLIHLYSISYMHEEAPHHFARYFAYLNLFVFSMLLLVMGSGFVIMFIGWEGVGLCSYLLIGYWFSNPNYNYAARKAFVMNRIGDLGFLLAIFWIISKLGTTEYAGVIEGVAKLSSTDLTAITLLLFVGAMGKSAQIPLYTWLPDAMAGPTPVSALIHAATMVTAGIYMIARTNLLYTMAPFTQGVVAITGLLTALFAASIALKQNDIKKVLAYSTVSQLGYMFLGLGVGAYTGAVFHVMTHAFFKALLFLGAGSVIHAMHHEQDIRKMGGLRKHLPVTHLTFLIGCLAIAGIPPLSGFFSKDEILAAAFHANPIYYVLGLGGALMTAFYMFRLYTLTFLGEARYHSDPAHPVHESPAPMLLPLVVLAVLSVAGGWIGIPEWMLSGGHRLEHFLAPIFAASSALAHEHAHLTAAQEWGMVGGATVAIVVVILLAIRSAGREKTDDQPASGILANKWYVDELYEFAIVQPIRSFADLLKNVLEKNVIDGCVNGVGRLIHYGSRQMRLIQSGQVGNYLLIMVLSMVVFFLIWFNDNKIMALIHKIF